MQTKICFVFFLKLEVKWVESYLILAKWVQNVINKNVMISEFYTVVTLNINTHTHIHIHRDKCWLHLHQLPTATLFSPFKTTFALSFEYSRQSVKMSLTVNTRIYFSRSKAKRKFHLTLNYRVLKQLYFYFVSLFLPLTLQRPSFRITQPSSTYKTNHFPETCDAFLINDPVFSYHAM